MNTVYSHSNSENAQNFTMLDTLNMRVSFFPIPNPEEVTSNQYLHKPGMNNS